MNENSTEILYVEHWKGKDEIKIYEQLEIFRVVEHRKSKETSEVNELSKVVHKKDVRALWNVLFDVQVGDRVSAKYLWRKLIELHGIAAHEGTSTEMMLNAFNGGKYRAKYYFPLYYYPLKILEAKGLVQYYGGGGCMRLSNDRDKI